MWNASIVGSAVTVVVVVLVSVMMEMDIDTDVSVVVVTDVVVSVSVVVDVSVIVPIDGQVVAEVVVVPSVVVAEAHVLTVTVVVNGTQVAGLHVADQPGRVGPTVLVRSVEWVGDGHTGVLLVVTDGGHSTHGRSGSLPSAAVSMGRVKANRERAVDRRGAIGAIAGTDRPQTP